MKNLSFHWLEISAMSVILLGTTALILHLFPVMRSSDIASWVQGIGSLGAILVAIWAIHKQHQNEIKRAASEERIGINNFLRGLRDEVWVTTEQFERKNGRLLMTGQAGSMFAYKIPVMDRIFLFYESTIDRLISIPNDELRRQIVIGYGRARGFIQSLKMNNEILRNLEVADHLAKLHHDPVHINRYTHHLEVANAYGDTLRGAYTEVIAGFKELLIALQNEITKNDQLHKSGSIHQ